MSNITKPQLTEIIKAVVKQCIAERKEFAQRAKQQNLKEGSMQEVAPPGFDPKGKHAKTYKKIMAQYKGNDAAAYATMWKLHNKLQEVVKEASYKIVSPNQLDTSKENKARQIQTEPDVNETAYKTQGPSYRTFKDSPQFPDAVNDPKNR